MYQFAFVLTHPKQAAAFTLIELSVVLVVIGLVVGGVLVGQDLIAAANMRAQISQIERIDVAATTFRLKYNCLPGDCKTATNFFGGTAQPEQVTNGNGNRQIEGFERSTWGGPWADGTNDYLDFGAGEEHSYVFDHLSAAQLFSIQAYDESSSANNRPGIAFPAAEYYSRGISNSRMDAVGASGNGGTVLTYQLSDADIPYVKTGHRVRLNTRGGLALQPWDALSFDTKIDDGSPFSGRVASVPTLGTYGATRFCGDPATNEYRTIDNLLGSWGQLIDRRCTLSVSLSF